MVAFDPGRMTSRASPGKGAPGGMIITADAGFGFKRIEIVEIGDVRQHRHGDR